MADDPYQLKLDKRYASRKFLFSVLVWLAATIGFATTKLGLWNITTDQWIDLSKFMVLAYMAGNVGDTAAEALRR